VDDIPILPSALQHFLYCPRQCALIHLEQQWEENVFTADGRLLHERVDQPGGVSRAGGENAVGFAGRTSGIGHCGVADVVGPHSGATGGRVYRVEYKRGKPKPHRADNVQLCAQALCLDVMSDQDIVEGALFYGRTRRRQTVRLDTA